MSIIICNCNHCQEQQFPTLSCVHYAIFSVVKLHFFIQALLLLLDRILTRKNYEYALRTSCSLWFGYLHLSSRPEERGAADTDSRAYSPSGQSSPYSLTTVSSSRPSDGRAKTDMNSKTTRTLVAYHLIGVLRQRECCMPRVQYGQLTFTQHELPPARLVLHRQTSPVHDIRYTGFVQLGSGMLALFFTQHQHNPTPTLREGWSGKWPLESTYHARIATSPQDTTTMPQS